MINLISTGHQKAVTAIVCDSVNRIVLSGSLDGTLHSWNFKNFSTLLKINLKSCISKMAYHRESHLLAVVTDDLCIHVLDTDTFKVVREFWGHEGPVTDVVSLNVFHLLRHFHRTLDGSFQVRWIVPFAPGTFPAVIWWMHLKSITSLLQCHFLPWVTFWYQRM
jgi:WD40 repeat protein